MINHKKIEIFGQQGNTKIGNTNRTIVAGKRRIIITGNKKINRGCKGCSRRQNNV